MRIRAAIVIGVVTAALAGPPSSQATVTIGPNLDSLTPAASGYNCSATHDCTLVNASVGPGFGSSLLVSPVSGSITRIRVRTGPAGSGHFNFRLLRPTGGGAYTGSVIFGVVPGSLPPNSTIELPGFPIDAGEAIGVDCCAGGGDNITSAAVPGSGNFLVWGTGTNAALGGNETRFPDSDHTDQLLMLNADIVPDNHFIFQGVKVKGRRVIATVAAPNPGVLTVESKLVRRTTVNVPAPAPDRRARFSQVVRLSAKTTKAGRARLSRAGKLKLQVTYTPSFGTATSLKKTAKR
jgi:hypothetical protein